MSKIFVIGFRKMGTTSLHRLFGEMGLASFHGHYDRIRDIAFLSQYQYFSDGEQHDFEWLDKTFPGSRFILLNRNVDDWIASRIKFVKGCRYAPALRTAREYEDNPVQAVEDWRSRLREYRAQVLAYFQGRDDLIEINVCEPQDSKALIQRIADFIGVETDISVFPHLNKAA